ARPRSLLEMLRIRDFALLYGATVFVSLGLFVPFVFIAAFAEDRGVGDVAAASLVGIIGGASVVGRLGLGGLADRVGAVRLFKASFVIVTLSHVIWLLAGGGYGILVLYTVVLGVGYGGFIALSPAVAALRFGLEGLGGLLGTMYTAAAIGSLAGPPLAGALIDNWGYRTAISFAVTVSAVAVLILSAFRLPEVGPAH
ncbi:MAG TPA: MFS transporter, partial [Acidimicrobiales bacterium]|nr:MFS transporter [Acidimicrobiales bacterium]